MHAAPGRLSVDVNLSVAGPMGAGSEVRVMVDQ